MRSRLLEELIERVLGCRSTVFGPGTTDVALRGGHRFVTEQLHQRVDADVGVGQFGGVSYLYLFSRKCLLFIIFRCPTREAREGVWPGYVSDLREQLSNAAVDRRAGDRKQHFPARV